MKVYVAGPMTGYHAYNYQRFMIARDFLRAQGFEAITPFECNNIVWRKHYNREFDPYNDKCDYGDPILKEMIAADLAHLLTSERAYVLDGWERSKGAKLEMLAALNAGIPIYLYGEERPMAIDRATVEFHAG